MDLSNLCTQTLTLVQEVAVFIAKELGQVEEIEVKAEQFNNLVSYVDKSSEQKLIEGLSRLLPEAVFLAEENTRAQASGDWRWIIDPLDGTTNFLHQLPCFAISVGLEHQGEMVLGVVHEISRSESFYAWKNGGAYLNGKRIQVSQRAGLREALIATGFPYHDFTRLEAYQKTNEHLMRHTRGIRRWGAAAVDLAYVACGRYDLFFEYHLQPWDVAAGGLLVLEAGGRVQDFQGMQEKCWTGAEMLAGAPQVLKEVEVLFQQNFA
jgi:myo-inositol-1(or 4)-monophosphatase